TVRIRQAQYRLAKLLAWPRHRHVELQGTGEPETDRFRGYGKGDFSRRSMADAARRTILPDKEGDERAQRSHRIAVEQVKLRRVIEAGRPLHQPQAEKSRIEIDIVLHLAGDQRHVVDA